MTVSGHINQRAERAFWIGKSGLNSNATVESHPGIMRQAVAERPDGETPSCPAAAFEVVQPLENFR